MDNMARTLRSAQLGRKEWLAIEMLTIAWRIKFYCNAPSVRKGSSVLYPLGLVWPASKDVWASVCFSSRVVDNVAEPCGVGGAFS